MLAPVVHGDRVPEHVGNDRRAPRPGLDDVLRVLLVLDFHLLEQVVVDERALLEAARHLLLPLPALAGGVAAANDQLVARLALATSTALGLTRRVHRVTTTRGLTLTTTVRVVDRVHGDTTDGRALALPPHAAGLAPVDVRLVGVADLADGGATAHVDTTDLAGRHTQRGVRPLTAKQLDADAGRTGQLGATAGTKLHTVDRRTDRDVAQGQVVPRLDVGRGAGLDRVTLLQVLRRHDVALLAVGVVQQCDPSGAVRVVLDVRDLGRHAVLVDPLEVDQPVLPLVATALVPRGDAAVDVATTLLGQRDQQRLLRGGPGDLGEVGDARAAAARRGRLVLTDSH